MVELLTLSAIQCKAPQCVHMVVIGPHVKVVTGTGSWYCCLAISIRCLPDEQFSHGNIAGQGLGGKVSLTVWQEEEQHIGHTFRWLMLNMLLVM
jgi:hypothetical protein